MTNESKTQFPLTIGSIAEFRTVRESLAFAGFNETTVCTALGINSMADLPGVSFEAARMEGAPVHLALCIKVFLLMDLMPRAELLTGLGADMVEACESLGLIRCGEYGEGICHTPVFLYPIRGMLIVSDRRSNPDLSKYEPPEDIVFPAIFGGTIRLLGLVPLTHADQVLELCSGSGAAAIRMAPMANKSVASDIIERAARFARFNAALNGYDNVEAVTGDMYEAVNGRMFDRIVVHPPYVPNPDVGVLWRDAGITGELLFRRAVEGLPEHLRRDGMAVILSIGIDAQDQPLEHRVRQWLGDAESEFDILSVLANSRPLDEFIEKLGRGDQGLTDAQRARVRDAFERENAVAVVYGCTAIRRRNKETTPWTARVALSDETTGSDLEWAFEWHGARMRPDFFERLMSLKLRVSSGTEVRVTYRAGEEGLEISQCLLETRRPFFSQLQVDYGVVELLGQFNGSSTVSEIYGSIAQETSSSNGTALDKFLGFIAVLMDYRFLEVESS